MNFSIIIPSRNAANLGPCSLAIWGNESDASIIVVDDGLPKDLFLTKAADFIPGVKPFIFARNVNIGIQAVNNPERIGRFKDEPRDVILLNDDALLQTPGGFTAMAAVAHDHPEYGLIAATTNVTGNLNQLPKGIGLREDPRQVCFICVYIPRTTIEKVGLLDERFVDYGCEDDDYCLRVRKAGLKLGIFDGCFVDHGSLTSSFRGGPRAGGDFHPNLKRFIAKWGHDNFGRPCRA